MMLTRFAAALLTTCAMAAPGVPAHAWQATTVDTAAYYFMLGRHLEGEGDIDGAVAAHKKAIGIEPDSAELRAELAALYARQERAQDAVAAAEAALERDPQNVEANRVLGSIYAALAEQRKPLKVGDNPAQYAGRAIAALEKARAGSSDLNLDVTLGRLYVQARSYDKAITVLSRVHSEQPGFTEGALLLATAYEEVDNDEAAIRTLEASLAENPRGFRAALRVAELHEKAGRWTEAAAAYERAHALNSRADLSPRRAAALINAGKGRDALELLKPLAARPNPEALVLYLYAVAQRQAKDIAGAEATARKLRSVAPEDPRGMYVLAQVLESKGDLAGAEKMLREIIGKDPLDGTALNYLGYMFAERGQRLDEAVELLQRAVKIEPDNPSFLDSLGWAYFQQGKIDLADAPLTEAAKKLPSSSVVQDHLGDLRFKQQRYADAVAAYERSLAGDGDSIDRALIEKKLQQAREKK